MRKTISKKIQLIVWNRDHWTCRYCGEPVFFAPTLKLLDEINPKHGYYHKNGKSGEILPLFQWRWASVDHINPVTKGGENDLDNKVALALDFEYKITQGSHKHFKKKYVTACWKCNLKWNDKTEGKPKPDFNNEIPKNINWDGFSGIYTKLQKEEDEWGRLLK